MSSSSAPAEIYLDHNATTPLLPQAAQAMAACQRLAFANPSSQHAAGRLARRFLEDAREEIASLLGARLSGPLADRLVFTSSGTEANNLALLGLAGRSAGHVVTSGIEHPSVLGPAAEIVRLGGRWTKLPTTPHGTANLAPLAAALAADSQNNDRPQLASLMWANNDTGALQPLAELVSLCQPAGVPVHTDAVQAIGKLPIDFHGLDLSLLTAAAHKIHGPRGIGLLIARHDVPLRPILFGGPQELELRPGTPTVALAVGFQTALRLAVAEMQARRLQLAAVQRQFEQSLSEGVLNLVVHGAGAGRLPTTSSVSLPGCDRRAMLMALDLAGVACSSGSACASGSEEPSPTLVAMGCSESQLGSSLRFSFGATTTAAEVAEAVRRILRIYNELRDEKTSTKNLSAARQSGSNSLQ